MNRAVRFGVVGAGAIAQRGIFPHLSQEDIRDQVVLHAVCDPAPGRAQAAADAYQIPYAYETLEDLLANDEVDALSIASPIGLHYEQGVAALKAGKHLHFNKTMTTTRAEADQLIELAAERNLRIVASPGEVLRPEIQRMRELVQEGAIGKLCWAVAGGSFGNYHENENEFRAGNTPLSNVNPAWYFRKPGGGPMYDIVSYCLHGLTSVLGPVKRVTGMSANRVQEREFQGQMIQCDADDNTLGVLDFGEGVFAFLHATPVGWLTEGFYPTLIGTKGQIKGFKLNNQPYDYPGRETAGDDPWTQRQWNLPHVTGPHRTIGEQHVYEDIMQLIDWIRDGKPSPVTAEHARHVIEVMEATFTSAESGQAVEVTSTFRWPAG